MRFIIDEPGLQERVRAEPALIAALLEEVLRLDGPIKMGARLARRDTRIGDVSLPAGTRVMVALPAANRDRRRWQDPEALVLDRPRIKEHIAFGRGAHTCAGAPLARAEVAVLLDRMLEHTSAITLSEQHHGTAADRRIDYEASYIIRGIDKLHVEFAPR